MGAWELQGVGGGWESKGCCALGRAECSLCSCYLPGIHLRKSWSLAFRLEKMSKVINSNLCLVTTLSNRPVLGAPSTGGSCLCGAKCS